MYKFVLAALLVFVFAPPTLAHHCAGGHANFPECNVDGEAGGIGTLLDANGDTIGQVVGISSGTGSASPVPTVSVLFEMPGQLFLADVISGVPGLPSNSGFKVSASVYFSDLDCQGTTWVEPQTEELLTFFGEFRAAIIATDTSDERRLFHVVPETAITEGVEVKPRMLAGCFSDNPTRDFFSVTELDPDLHVTLPKPYSLNLE